jgi:hypothetical protein
MALHWVCHRCTLERFAEDAGRWLVLCPSGERVRVRPDNLVASVSHCSGTCANAASEPEVTHTPPAPTRASGAHGGGDGGAEAVRPETLSVRELRAALAERGLSYAHCVEKADLVAMLREATGAF